jgi:hypothetical protein
MRRRWIFAAMAALVVAPGARGAITTTTALDLGALLGADRFYNAGYTGSRSIVANIEGGHIWNGHETLGQVNTFLADGARGDFDAHATAVGFLIGGRGTRNDQRGIAYGSTLWSGAIATSFNGSNFSFSTQSLFGPYQQAMVTGVNGATADVINSSWGFGGNSSGNSQDAQIMNALVAQTGKTVVFAAGNRGPGANTMSAPATAANVIAVASLGTDTSAPAYNSVSSTSSRGPEDFYNPQTGQTISGVRAKVDIAAPGEELRVAFYGGTTGSNTGGTDVTNGANNFYARATGTSFAAPIVAAGAALLDDVGHDRFGGGQSIDARTIKAVLLNSADKTAGWNNGQALGSDGVVRTTQSLDFATGAGRVDMNKAFDQYTAGTTNVPGLGGGAVLPIGWDYGTVAEGSPDDYLIGPSLLGGTTFTATLDWLEDATVSAGGIHSTAYHSFDNLDLQVWETSSGSLLREVAESSSTYNNVEHLNFALPDTANYMIRVLWDGKVYDVSGDPHNSDFGLAWNATAIPEPGAFAMVFACIPVLMRRRRSA